MPDGELNRCAGSKTPHLPFSSRKVYGFCGIPWRRPVEGVARPDGAPLVGVVAPSMKGLRLEVWSTCGEKMTGVGVTVEVMGTYVGTVGLVGVRGGVTTGSGGNTGGVWVIGDTTLTGLCGLGVTRGGGILIGGEEGKEGGF